MQTGQEALSFFLLMELKSLQFEDWLKYLLLQLLFFGLVHTSNEGAACVHVSVNHE